MSDVWQPIAGATGRNFTYPMAAGLNNYRFRCRFTNSSGEVVTATAVLRLGAPPIGEPEPEPEPE